MYYAHLPFRGRRSFPPLVTLYNIDSFSFFLFSFCSLISRRNCMHDDLHERSTKVTHWDGDGTEGAALHEMGSWSLWLSTSDTFIPPHPFFRHIPARVYTLRSSIIDPQQHTFIPPLYSSGISCLPDSPCDGVPDWWWFLLFLIVWFLGEKKQMGV